MSSHFTYRLVASLAALAAAAGFSVNGAHAASVTPAGGSPAPVYAAGGQDTLPNGWFVELSNNPTIEGGTASSVNQQQSSVRSAAKSLGITYSERHAYGTLWNGFAITASTTNATKFSTITGVKALYRIGLSSLPPSNPVTSPADAYSNAMIGADYTQSTLGYTGQGVKVGIIDTGIDYTHPDLGGCAAFAGCTRVAYGYDFVGDNYDANPTDATYNPVPTPDPDPLDCAGHGTHVAGIIGADGVPALGGVVGVAPQVTFGAYRVFGCHGSVDDSIILQALERTYTDHMQVINMSLGADYQSWPQYPDALASTRLVNNGVVVVAAAGNAGNNGVGGEQATGSPSTGDKVISVASFDNTKITQNSFTISPDNKAIGYINGGGSPPAPKSGTLPFGLPQSGNQLGCSAITTNLTGEAALIKRGSCNFVVKEANAIAAGASAVVLYNSGTAPVTPAADGATVPVVMISLADGNTIATRLAGGPVSLTWSPLTVTSNSTTGGLTSGFSSYGLAADLSLKPDLAAPGGNIWSTWPSWLGGYASLSGTSMATPHVTGAVALLLQARPHTPSNAVRGILQNTAIPTDWFGFPGAGYIEPVDHQGAGLIHIDSAILSTTSVSPAKLSLGSSVAGPSTNTLTLTNSSNAPVTYTLSHQGALSTEGEFSVNGGWDDSYASVAFSSPSVTVPANGSATVTATITANPALADTSIYGGYLVFTPTTDGQIYRVPYAGFKGDYLAVDTLSSGGNGFPWLASAKTSPPAGDPLPYIQQSAGTSYTLAGTDVPYILFHLDYPARTFRAEVFDASSGKAWGRIDNEDYLPRNSLPTSYFSLKWTGETVLGNTALTVPNGQYVIKVTVIKATGDASNPAAVQAWTSPSFTLARP